jgi:hypothetical protein
MISNNIVSDSILCTNFSIDMSGLKVTQITEWTQSWVFRDKNGKPFLNAEYNFFYSSLL